MAKAPTRICCRARRRRSVCTGGAHGRIAPQAVFEVARDTDGRGELLHLFIVVLEKRDEDREIDPRQLAAVLTAKHVDRPDAHHPAGGAADEVEQD